MTPPKAIKHDKVEIDASSAPVGRVATKIAMYLMGKTKPGYVAHIDNGLKVVVTNVDKIHFTGKKTAEKLYRHHSMHPGGLKEKPAKELMQKDPAEIIRHAVSKMLPRNKMHTERMKRLTFK